MPRVTGDIDFFVSRSKENQALLREVLSAFGFASSLSPEPAEILPPNRILMLGRQPNRIDIISSIDGVNFEEAWVSRKPGEIDGLFVNFISAELLLRNKQSTKRLKDKADAENLSKLLTKKQ